MSDETLQKLIDMISAASPIVWEATLRRVYVVVAADLVWGVILFVLAHLTFKYAQKEKELDNPMFLGIIVFLVLGGALITTSGLMWLGSPTYSALKFLMDIP